ncbi:MAG: WGR domain-containing protein [Thermonemataceae bacterium]|nr:WGR domain-containing protein [Thermonemataceae bacterium]
MKKRLQFTDEKSSKFWQIEIAENTNSFTVIFGRTGTVGQSQIKTFDTAEIAFEEAEKLVTEKLKKGYIEVEIVSVPSIFSKKFEQYLPDLDDIQGLNLNWNHLFEGCSEDYPFPNVGVDSLYAFDTTGHDHLVYIPQINQQPENYPIAIFNEEEGNAETIASSILTWFPSYLVFRVNELLAYFVKQKGNNNQQYAEKGLQSIYDNREAITLIVRRFDNQAFEIVLPEIFGCIAQRNEENIMQKWDYVRFYTLAEKDTYLSQIVQIETVSPNDEDKFIAYHVQYPTINRGLNRLFYEYDTEYDYFKLRKSEKIAHISPEIAERVLFSDVTIDFGNTIDTTNVWRTCAEILQQSPQYTSLQKLANFLLEEKYEQAAATYLTLAKQLAEPASTTSDENNIDSQNRIQWAMNATKNAIYFYNRDKKEFYTSAFEFIKKIAKAQNDLNYLMYLKKMRNNDDD